MNSIYLQHDLTPTEIARDNARNAAIARNKAKRRDHTPRQMTEMRYHADNMSPAQGMLVDQLLADLRAVDVDTWTKANTWFNGIPGDEDNIGARVNMTKGQVTEVINRLKLRINEAKQRLATPAPRQGSPILGSMRTITPSGPRDHFADVPDGYYAVETEKNVLAFYRVSTWKNSVNRKVQIQASEKLHPVKGYAARDAILAKIREATAPVAGLRYAHEIGKCWRCGTTLTDPESRARGIGPVCIDKM